MDQPKRDIADYSSFTIFIAAHERHEAVEAWKDKLSAEQQEKILDMDCAWKIIMRLTGTTIEPLEL